MKLPLLTVNRQRTPAGRVISVGPPSLTPRAASPTAPCASESHSPVKRPITQLFQSVFHNLLVLPHIGYLVFKPNPLRVVVCRCLIKRTGTVYAVFNVFSHIFGCVERIFAYISMNLPSLTLAHVRTCVGSHSALASPLVHTLSGLTCARLALPGAPRSPREGPPSCAQPGTCLAWWMVSPLRTPVGRVTCVGARYRTGRGKFSTAASASTTCAPRARHGRERVDSRQRNERTHAHTPTPTHTYTYAHINTPAHP